MKMSDATRNWLLDSDPALRWQVERDLLETPSEQWQATRDRVGTEGFGAQLLNLQDEDGQWAGGAYFPGRNEPRAIHREDDSEGQPYIATTWSLNSLREWGVEAALLGDTSQRLNANGRWINERREKGAVWFEVDCPTGDESQWLTFFALRVLSWWDASARGNGIHVS